MATLVLTTVGGIVGGPIGAAIGGALGNAVDREILFKPKGREGPRLRELAVQTSSYGTQIPRLFGTMRVAGSVIWATDLIEHRSSESGGKGRPRTTSYSYTASFAVALSARPILSVGRIWADGKLLRGAAGDFKTRTGFRLHTGSEDQGVDPLIASVEGVGRAPAHRGTAYAVFEDLELADFGNRIPSLTFEVTADAGGASIGAILNEIGGGMLASENATQVLGGFSAHGDSLRAVAETLAGAQGGWFQADGALLTLMHGDGALVTLNDAGVSESGGGHATGKRTIAATDSAPRCISLSHYDPARDYQVGVQRAMRPGAGNRESRLELPAVIAAGQAKSVAEAMLARLDNARERRSVTLGWEALTVPPGARVAIGGAPGMWRVDRWSFEAMTVTLECVRVSPASQPSEASGGRVSSAPDTILGQTLIHAFELPPMDDNIANAPCIAVAAAGTAPGWRSATLLSSTDGGARWDPAGTTALPAVLGTIVVPPGSAVAALEDRHNSMDVELAHSAMALADADGAGMQAGANLAIVGDELVQFARAQPIGVNRWRLSGLWRGRRGTEGAIGTQSVGDRFALLSPKTIATVDVPLSTPGSAVQLLAQGAGDETAVAATVPIVGASIAPPSPVHLVAETGDGGDTVVRWIRRSRVGWRWIDGVDAPLGEEAERYAVSILIEGAVIRTAEATQPVFTVSEGERSAGCRIRVCQIGSHALSRPAELILEATGDSE